ncbi:MAG TPA: hypothetical protein VFB43_17605 [Terracidiphilus sp.]|nr:hypothetical protein [Terracidiphilus sp.]
MLKTIKRYILLFGAAILLLASSLSGAAQDKGYWRAASTNSAAITGDISISETKVTIDFTGFTIAQIHKLTPAEAAAIFDLEGDNNGSGNLYRMNIPAAKRFLHRNTLCGSDDTQWMATYASGRTLQIAFFSGPDLPIMTPDALAKSTNLCGTFAYVH